MYEIAGLPMKNRCMNACGILSEIDRLYKWQDLGVGALIPKTTTLPKIDGDNILIRNPWGTLNWIGLTNPGLDGAIESFEQCGKFKVPVIGSIFGINAKEIAKGLDPYVDARELNVSCPNEQNNVPNYRI